MIRTLDELMTDVINEVHKANVAGGAQTAVHPGTKGLMMMFYFHPSANFDEVHALLHEELARLGAATQIVPVEDDDSGPLPPKDPRYMN